MARPGSSRMRSDRPAAGLCRNQRPWGMPLSTSRRRGIEEDVRGLQIEVKQAGRVYCAIAVSDRFHELGGGVGRHWSPKPLLQASSRHEFQHQVQPAASLGRVVNLDDVGVANPSEGSCFRKPALRSRAPAIGPLATISGPRSARVLGSHAR